MNFDAKTGKQITWEDIFADDVDCKSEIAGYQEYRSFIEETPITTEFNYNKMFLLTPTNILIGDDYNSVYCENKNMDFFDNRHKRTTRKVVLLCRAFVSAIGERLLTPILFRLSS